MNLLESLYNQFTHCTTACHNLGNCFVRTGGYKLDNDSLRTHSPSTHLKPRAEQSGTHTWVPWTLLWAVWCPPPPRPGPALWTRSPCVQLCHLAQAPESRQAVLGVCGLSLFMAEWWPVWADAAVQWLRVDVGVPPRFLVLHIKLVWAFTCGFWREGGGPCQGWPPQRLHTVPSARPQF